MALKAWLQSAAPLWAELGLDDWNDATIITNNKNARFVVNDKYQEATRRIRTRMEKRKLLQDRQGVIKGDDEPRCDACRGRVVHALAGGVRLWRDNTNPNQPLQLTTDEFSASDASRGGWEEVNIQMHVRLDSRGEGGGEGGAGGVAGGGGDSAGAGASAGVDDFVLPEFVGVRRADGSTLSAVQRLVEAVERGWESNGVSHAPIRSWTEEGRLKAWGRLEKKKRTALSNRFSELMAVYVAAVHRDESGAGADDDETWITMRRAGAVLLEGKGNRFEAVRAMAERQTRALPSPCPP